MIAIKEMRMPDSCAECPFSFYDERISDAEERWVCELSPTKRFFDPEIKRQDWCPLVEAVTHEDYVSMQQTCYKLQKALAKAAQHNNPEDSIREVKP